MLAIFAGDRYRQRVFERWHAIGESPTPITENSACSPRRALFPLGSAKFRNAVFLIYFKKSFPSAQVAACVLALLPATILFGFNFPLVLSLITASDGRNVAGGEDFAESVGHTAAANTAGAICASIAGGFFLLPWLGSFRLVALAASVNVTLGVVLFLRANVRNWKAILVATALLVAIGWTAGSSLFFSKASAAYGVVLYGNFHNPALTAREMADTEDIAFFKDGINATIAVARSENYVALKTTRKVDASNCFLAILAPFFTLDLAKC
jgi:hypothetical protein